MGELKSKNRKGNGRKENDSGISIGVVVILLV
jgi:hypothetical protein